MNCSNKPFENTWTNFFWTVKKTLEVFDKLHASIGDFEYVLERTLFPIDNNIWSERNIQ